MRLVRNRSVSTTMADGDRFARRQGTCTVLRLTTLVLMLTQSQSQALAQSLALLVQDVVDRGKSRRDSSDNASHGGDGE